MQNGKNFAFLGKSFSRYIVFLIIATVGVIAEKLINYKYIIVQKAVQEGHVAQNWEIYMCMAGLTIFVSILLRIVKVFFTMWVEKVQKINFFKTYNGFLQQDGKLQGALKDLTAASAKVHCVIEVIETIISSTYIVLIMGVISLSLPEYIGAAGILVSGISLGFWRGKLQAKTDLLGAETQSLQQKLSNFFMISSNVLDERLNEIESNYWKRILLQCFKNAIQVLPDFVKIASFIALFYKIVETGMAENQIYPYTYIVLTVYGYIVSLSSNLSNLLEFGFKIVLYKYDDELKENQDGLEKRSKEIKTNERSVSCKENGIVVEKTFTAPVTRPNGETAFYKILKTLVLRKGQLILLEGENGTGKSRFCKLLDDILGAICYDAKTGMVEQVSKNFIRGKSSIDFNLIKHLAKGLEIQRIPDSKTDFFQLKCSAINSADRQMLIALQILYFAIKESEKDSKTQLIILDEILANLSQERTQKVLPFMVNELNKIGACTIIVSHSHKEEVKKYASAIWQMRNNENEVIIEERPVY